MDIVIVNGYIKLQVQKVIYKTVIQKSYKYDLSYTFDFIPVTDRVKPKLLLLIFFPFNPINSPGNNTFYMCTGE